VKQSHKTLLLWVLLILMFVAIYNLVAQDDQPRSVPFSEFVMDVRGSKVDRVDVRPLDNSAEYTYWVKGANDARQKKVSIGILGEEFNKELLEQNIKVKYLPEDQNGIWTSILVTWLPMIFLLVIFFFFMRQLQASGGKAMSFGKSRARLLNESQNKVTFATSPASTRPRTTAKRSSPS
jgi:cell division protease FtsH